jgi:glutathione transport system substrate-binding protein
MEIRKLLSGVVGAAALLLSTTVGTQVQAAAPSANITIAVSGDAVCLLPYNTNDNLSFGVESNIYQGLVGYNGKMQLVGELAKSWKVAPNATSITFYLNPAAKFSDGTPVTAQAVKQSFTWLLNPKNNLVRTALYSVISKINVLNTETVQFVLSKPFGAILPTFAHPAGAVVEPKVLSKGVNYLCANPVGGTGPFVFKDWVQGDHITLVRNANYWNKAGAAKVASITYKPVADASARIAGLETGQFQAIYPVPNELVQSLKGQPGINVQVASSNAAWYVAMNTQFGPFKNVLVRQALNYAVDKNTFIKVVWGGFGSVLHSPVPPADAYAINAGNYPYNPAKAKQLLAKAGYPHGFTSVLWVGNSTESIYAATFVQQQLAQIGVNIKVEPMDNASLSSSIFTPSAKQNLRMNYSGWSASTGDADWALRPLLATSSWPPSLYNLAFFGNKSFDSYLEQGLNSGAPKVRAAAYTAAQKLAWQQAPWIYLGVSDNIWATRSNVKGIVVREDEVPIVYGAYVQ